MINARLVFLFVSVLIPISTMADPQELSTSINQFAGSLYNTVASGNKDNLIMSPLSVQTVLSLVSMGAGGNTATQIAAGLRQPQSKEKIQDDYHALMNTLNTQKGVTLEIANKVYVMEGYTLKPTFKEVATNKFLAGAENLNFAQNAESAKVINTWVEEKTHDKIHDLIKAGDLDQDSRMVLVNALYFKGLWEKQFKKENTQDKPFYVTETETKNVRMMHIKDKFRYGEFEELDAKAVELPYRNSDLAMLIILPNSKTGLPALEEKLQNVDLQNLTQRMYSVEVILDLPKFKIESEINLNDPLKKLGMSDMFVPGKADFKGLLEGSDEMLYISKVIQKAFIEVNEEGAEAAAATACHVRMKRSLLVSENPISFNADHMFTFMIVDSGVSMSKQTKVIFRGCVRTCPEIVHTRDEF
ncbi:antichymotrypsin-2-like isoform X4 [Ctenocephalides felis]|uniref:antichymotrypsin-2-like isoform X4 n=1 Tax=Ctenocephalides felis TaxID=7515 RepID=UPI000E6E5653|nr:antichymotrypsin-2-like isoform X4 [Ctenocephalides felis]